MVLRVARKGREGLLVAGLVALALALRFYDLTGESLWYDEAYSVWSSSMDIASLRLLWEWQVEFPLYYLLLHFWMRLFGQGEFAVRAFGALASAVAVIPMYALGKALLGRRAGTIGALLWAVNPYQVWYAQEVRMYAWAALFTLISWYTFWRLVQDGRWGWGLGYVLATGLTFHLHYYIGWVVLVQNVFYLWWLQRHHGPLWQREAWRHGRWWLLAQGGVALLALPAAAVFYTKLIGLNQWGWLAARYGAPGLGAWADLFALYTLGLAFPGPSGLRWGIVALFLALASAGAVLAGRRRGPEREAVLLALLALGLPLAILWVLGQFAAVWVPRYLLLLMPAYLLLVALGLACAPRWGLRLGGVLLVVAASLYALSGMYGGQQKEDWRGVAAYIAQHGGPNDLIVLLDEECRVPFSYYYGSGGARVEVSRFADDAALDRAVAEIVRRQRGGHLWLVVSHADGRALQERLRALPGLRQLQGPAFVGIELVTYVWS